MIYNKALYFPCTDTPRVVLGKSFKFDEYLAISPDLYLMYNSDTGDIYNLYLLKFGLRIPGDAIIFATDDQGEQTDIPEDLLEKLPEILGEDKKKRKEFIDRLC